MEEETPETTEEEETTDPAEAWEAPKDKTSATTAEEKDIGNYLLLSLL